MKKFDCLVCSLRIQCEWMLGGGGGVKITELVVVEMEAGYWKIGMDRNE